jgi:hypothetical protein
LRWNFFSPSSTPTRQPDSRTNRRTHVPRLHRPKTSSHPSPSVCRHPRQLPAAPASAHPRPVAVLLPPLSLRIEAAFLSIRDSVLPSAAAASLQGQARGEPPEEMPRRGGALARSRRRLRRSCLPRRSLTMEELLDLAVDARTATVR